MSDSDEDGVPDEAVEYKFYFNIKSDPTKMDTDGDGLNDNIDNEPIIQNPVIKQFDANNPQMTLIGSARDRTNNVVRDVFLVTSEFKNIFINEYENNEDYKNAILVIDYTDDDLIDYCIYNSYIYSVCRKSLPFKKKGRLFS